MDRKRWKKLLLRTVKIALGSCAAIYVAEAMQLEYATSAGSIALLTLMTTKWETLKLSVLRILTFFMSATLAWIAFAHIESEWVAFGAFIFVMIILSELLGLRATISVNAVIGTHFLVTRDFSIHFVMNECYLVLIGITVAILLNLYHANHYHKKDIIQNMRFTEQQLQLILTEVAAYLLNQETPQSVWVHLKTLESRLHEFTQEAYEYQDNTFYSHPGYYIDYFEMRMTQCYVLHSLHYEMRNIRTMPKQAKIVAEYIVYLVDYVTERNVPKAQLERLQEIFREMEKEPLPVSREEFEGRAMLYHILMDLEEFINFKTKFVNSLDERQMKLYWKTKEE